MASHQQPPAEEPLIEVGGFEADLFWAKHRTTIIGGIVAAVVILVGVAIWVVNDYTTRAAAQAAFANAKTPEAWRAVIADYPKSEPAAGAYFLVAESLREQGNLTESTATYNKFLENFPQHPLAGGARLGIAENLNMGTDPKAALDALRAVKAEDSSSYAAPFAVLMEGRTLMQEGKLQEARKVFSSLVAEYSQSVPARIASMHLDQLAPLLVQTGTTAPQ